MGLKITASTAASNTEIELTSWSRSAYAGLSVDSTRANSSPRPEGPSSSLQHEPSTWKSGVRTGKGSTARFSGSGQFEDPLPACANPSRGPWSLENDHL